MAFMGFLIADFVVFVGFLFLSLSAFRTQFNDLLFQTAYNMAKDGA